MLYIYIYLKLFSIQGNGRFHYPERMISVSSGKETIKNFKERFWYKRKNDYDVVFDIMYQIFCSSTLNLTS